MAIRQFERLLDRFEHLRSPGMDDPGSDIAAAQAMLAEERIDVRREVGLDKLAKPRRQHDLEAVLRYVPPHEVLGIGVECRFRREDLRLGSVERMRCQRRFGTGYDDCRGAL